MKARVRSDQPTNVVRAFSFREFIKREWREVPAGFEAEAERHPLLEILVEPAAKPEEEQEQKPVKAARKSKDDKTRRTS